MTEIHNIRTGQTMRFVSRSPELLRIETVNPAHAPAEPLHVHPRQESSAEVVSGALRFVVDGAERWLGPAATAIPAGTPHNFRNDGDEDAVAIQEFRPALRIAEFFTAFFALADNGELDEKGMPSLLRMSVMAPQFSDEIRVVKPPWSVQRAVFALLRPVARLRGDSAIMPAPTVSCVPSSMRMNAPVTRLAA